MAKTTTSFLHSFKLFGLTLFLIVSYQTSQAQIDSTHFVSTWLTSMQGSSNSQSITLFTDANYSYNYDVDWDNDGVFEDTNVRGNITHQYPTAGRYTVRIKGIFPRIYFGDSTNSSWQNDCMKLISINQWGDQEWESFSHAFQGCELMSMNATDVPNLDSVNDLSYAFANVKGTFNSSINHWGVSNVTNMEGTFYQAIAFNSPIGNWDASSVINMRKMFREATAFNQPIGNWNVSNVTDMYDMFLEATSFNQPIGNWNVGNVRNMHAMFWRAYAFNQPIGNWNVSNVRNMHYMFVSAVTFNQPIGNWSVGNVRDMQSMFSGAYAFDQDISNWDVSNVRNMWGMFRNANSFNQDISDWDVSNVGDMYQMFKGATSFNQNLGNWDISNLIDMSGIFTSNGLRNAFDSCGLSTANYDSTLIGWQAKPHPINLTVGAANVSYCASDSVRNLLITNSGWSFVGDTFDCVTVGLEKQEKPTNHFKVYPNPTQGQITLESNVENMDIPLFIYNMQGQKVKSVRLESQPQQIDLSDLPAGLYFVVQGENRQKLVLEQ